MSVLVSCLQSDFVFHCFSLCNCCSGSNDGAVCIYDALSGEIVALLGGTGGTDHAGRPRPRRRSAFDSSDDSDYEDDGDKDDDDDDDDDDGNSDNNTGAASDNNNNVTKNKHKGGSDGGTKKRSRIMFGGPGHDDVVRDVSWHPHKPMIVSTSWDGTCRLWSYSEGPNFFPALERREQENSWSYLTREQQARFGFE